MENKTKWYIIITRRGKEFFVTNKIKKFLEKPEKEKNKEEKNITSKIKKIIIPGEKNKNIKGIFFCNIFQLDWEEVYFFYQFPEIISFFSHQRTNRDELPKPVEEQKIIEILKEREEPELIKKEKEENKKESLKVGDRIKIKSGPFFSYEGKIEKINTRTEKVSVNLEYDGQNWLINNIYLEKVSINDCSKVFS